MCHFVTHVLHSSCGLVVLLVEMAERIGVRTSVGRSPRRHFKKSVKSDVSTSIRKESWLLGCVECFPNESSDVIRMSVIARVYFDHQEL